MRLNLNKNIFLLLIILRIEDRKRFTAQEITNALIAQSSAVGNSTIVSTAATYQALLTANVELNGKLQRRVVKAQQSMLDLFEVARKICRTYVCDTATNQVNLSSHTRSETVRRIKQWNESLHHHGQHHYVMVEPDNDGQQLEEGETILLVRREGQLFRAISYGDHYLPRL